MAFDVSCFVMLLTYQRFNSGRYWRTVVCIPSDIFKLIWSIITPCCNDPSHIAVSLPPITKILEDGAENQFQSRSANDQFWKCNAM